MVNKMIKCLIITDIETWVVGGAGHIARLKMLIAFLTKYSYVTIVHIGTRPLRSVDDLLPPKVNLIVLNNENKFDKEKNLTLLTSLFEFEKYKICFIEYIHNSFYLKAIPDEVISILDTHDIISDRNQSFHKLQYPNLNYDMPKEKEYKIYNLYDYVMFISKKEYDKSIPHLNEDQMILAPHPATLNKHEVRDNARVIGFIASDYLPNVDSIKWFLEWVWPKIPMDLDVELHIYGDICKMVPTKLLLENVILKGFTYDLIRTYSEMDIAINPVRMGSGLKIKNVEALANGVPLLTTTHGASALEEGIDSAFLIADDETAFSEKLIRLITDLALRKELSSSAFEWASEKFGEEECFKDLKEILLS